MTSSQNISAIAIGASAGAIETLSAILPALPSSYPASLFVVIHLPPDRESVAADLFQSKCKMKVKEAEDKESIEPGTIYFAPPDYHLLVEPNNRLSLSAEERVMFSRPSIDVLFESAADAYGERLLGIVLTGANQDGADGLRMVLDSGGKAIVQSPESAYASAMPEAALRACPEALELEIPAIVDYLCDLGAEEAR